MMRHALAMGAAVLAAAPVVLSPLTACADFEPPMTEQLWDSFKAWEQKVDGIGSPSEWSALISSGFGAYFGKVAGLIYAVYSDNTAAVVPGDFGGYGGIYTDSNGKQRFGSVYTYSRSYDTVGRDPVPHSAFIALADSVYTIEVTPTYASSDDYTYTWTYTPGGYSNSDGTFVRSLTIKRYHAGYQERLYSSWDVRGGSDLASGAVGSGYDVEFSVKLSHAAIAPTWPGIATAIQGNAVVFGSGLSIGDLPTSEDYPTLTRDNLGDYIRDVLNPATVENDPAIEPYIFDPFPAPSPTYPVAETWNENADWPEGNLLPTIPAASYTVEIPQVMTEGAAFWWRCLGVLFDGLGITGVVVGLLALGIVLYFVLR